MFDPNEITIEEIYAAQATLVSFGLPPEIATIILDFAEYWHQQRCTKEVPLKLLSRSLDFTEVSSLYLQTPSIGRGEGLDELSVVRPRKVVFRLTSQNINLHFGRGLYENNRSWFDASIFREDESWTGGDRQEPIYALHLKAISAAPFAGIDRDQEKLEPGDEFAIYYWGNDPFTLPPWFCQDGSKFPGGFKVIHNGEKPTWLLQRNRYMSDTSEGYLEHTVVWKREDVGELREEEWPLNGSGSGINFVASLQRGDRIGVWARANVSGFKFELNARCLLLRVRIR
jgi:hypothetical protein